MNTIELMIDLSKQILNAVPGLQDSGDFIQENYDGDGRYMGDSQIDPMAVIQQMQELATKAIAAGEAELKREPTVYVMPGENCDLKGWVDAKAWPEGEFTRPLWTREEI